MFASTALNYLDRQAVTLVGENLKSEFRISNATFGWVLAAFQLSYAFFQVPAGLTVDRVDTRRLYAFAVIWWSLAAIGVAFAPGLAVLMVFRALLGLGESFNWPCALRVTARVLPPGERSLGNGIFNSGAAVGAVLTPLLVTPLTALLGWRYAFGLIGLLGFVWVAVWLWSVRGEAAARLAKDEGVPHGERRGLSKSGREALLALAIVSTAVGLSGLIPGVTWGVLPAVWWGVATLMCGLLLVARVLPEGALGEGSWWAGLGVIVRNRRFWVMAIVSVSINVCWHFLVNWLPTYLKTDRGMTFLTGGFASALPFLAADAGNLVGGWASSRLVSGGRTPAAARLMVVAACTVILSAGAWVGFVESNAVVLTLLALMAFGTAAFMANYFAFAQEVDPRHTGLIVGVLGGLGNLFAAGFSPVAGTVKDTVGSFTAVFVVVGVLPVVGLAALGVGWGRRGVGSSGDG